MLLLKEATETGLLSTSRTPRRVAGARICELGRFGMVVMVVGGECSRCAEKMGD